MDNRTYFHLAAFRGSVGIGGVNVAIAGVLDNILARAASNNFLAPDGARIRFATAGGVDTTRSRINTPSLRAVGLPYIAPLNQGVAAPSPMNVADYGDFGPLPATADEISVEATQVNAGAQISYALMGLKFGRKEWTPGQRYRVRGTAAIAGVVGSWASGAITLDQTLPSGVYQIQGMDAFGTNLLGARLIFTGGGWRPGILARNTVAGVPHPLFTDGSLGVYGEFDSVTPPQLEIYVEAANAAQEVYLDIVRVGNRNG